MYLQELVESCADLNASNGVKKLTDIMAKISNFSHDINAALEDIKKMLAVNLMLRSSFTLY